MKIFLLSITCVFLWLFSFGQISKDTIIARQSKAMRIDLNLDSLQFLKISKLNKNLMANMDSVYQISQTADARTQSIKRVNKDYRKEIKDVLTTSQFTQFLAKRKSTRDNLKARANQRNVRVKEVLTQQDDD